MIETIHIAVCMKPVEGTLAENALQHGVAGLNIDACRVGTSKGVPASPSRTSGNSLCGSVDGSLRHEKGTENGHNPNIGRFPANVILDGSDEVVAEFSKSKTGGPGITKENHNGYTMSGPASNHTRHTIGYDDDGSAARFFKAYSG